MDNNKNLAISIVCAIFGMVLLAYASAPLYNLFCKVTGYGGTVKVVKHSASKIGNRQIKVSFDANISKELGWVFKPLQKNVKVKTGENAVIFYYAKNTSNRAITGTAVYNVTPYKAGQYFNKIQCFCFQEQILEPGQEMDMPVSFFIDPELETDKNLKDLSEITLSYSFYPVNQQTPKNTQNHG